MDFRPRSEDEAPSPLRMPDAAWYHRPVLLDRAWIVQGKLPAYGLHLIVVIHRKEHMMTVKGTHDDSERHP